jgi:hypothetical protein
MHARKRQCTPVHANARQSTPMHARLRQCTPVHAKARHATILSLLNQKIYRAIHEQKVLEKRTSQHLNF